MTILFDNFKGNNGILLAKMFNKKPKDAIEHIEKIVMENINAQRSSGVQLSDDKAKKMVAEQISAFFTDQKQNLNLTKVGDFVGDDPSREQNKYNMLVLEDMANSAEFKGMSLNKALRQFLTMFKLPGEAQKIDRIVEKFAHKYVADNAEVEGFEFDLEKPQDNNDAAYVAAFQAIMLMTDLHNPSVEKKMSLDELKRNLRGVKGNTNFSDAFLQQFYDDAADSALENVFPETPAGISFDPKSLGSDGKFKSLTKNISSIGYDKVNASSVFPGIKSDSGYTVKFAKPKGILQRIFGGYTGVATVSKGGQELATVNISRGGWLSRLFGAKSTLSIEPITHKEIADQEAALVAAATIAAQFDASPEFKSTFAYEKDELEKAYDHALDQSLDMQPDGMSSLRKRTTDSSPLLTRREKVSAPGESTGIDIQEPEVSNPDIRNRNRHL